MKPTALKRLQGTLKKSRENKLEPKPAGDLDINSPPEWLNQRQREGWAYILAHAPGGLLKSLDRGALLLWIIAEEQHRTAVEAQAKLDQDNKLPLLTRDKDGNARTSPYVKIMRDCALVMLRCCSELGFSPASRPRVQVVPERSTATDQSGRDPWKALALHRVAPDTRH